MHGLKGLKFIGSLLGKNVPKITCVFLLVFKRISKARRYVPKWLSLWRLKWLRNMKVMASETQTVQDLTTWRVRGA